MAQLVIELKQHTPILHFQHGQQGATLRATEVKPKLDKFIHQVFERKKLSLNPDWLIGPDKRALDYKMRIRLKGEGRQEFWVRSISDKGIQAPNPIAIIKKSPYFAQMEADQDLKERFDFQQWNTIGKKGLLWHYPLEITIFSLHKDLLAELSKRIEDFFICTNFGTRSDKGFGSFTVSRINGSAPTKQADRVLPNHFDFVYKKKYAITNADAIALENEIFKIIADDFMKIRNYMEAYVKNGTEWGNGLEWDRNYFKKIVQKQETDANDYLYVRGLLGLPSFYSYEQLPGEPVVNVREDSGEIERFPSPLLFKVIQGYIYILGNKDAIDCMLDRDIEVDCSVSEEITYMLTPESFDLDNYLSSAIQAKKLNYKKLIRNNKRV